MTAFQRETFFQPSQKQQLTFRQRIPKLPRTGTLHLCQSKVIPQLTPVLLVQTLKDTISDTLALQQLGLLVKWSQLRDTVQDWMFIDIVDRKTVYLTSICKQRPRALNWLTIRFNFDYFSLKCLLENLLDPISE